MEGITNTTQLDEQKKNQASKSASPSASAMEDVAPRPNLLGTSHIGPTRQMTRPAVPLKPILPAEQVIKKTGPMSAFARAKTKRERLLASMNDYSTPAPEVVERAKEKAEQKPHVAHHPACEDTSMTEGPQTRTVNTMTLEVRPTAPVSTQRKLQIPRNDAEKHIYYTTESEQEYLRSYREAQDPDAEDKKNPYLKQYFEDEEVD